MSPGRPTLGDVARIAGVHKATASRALNPATLDRVNPETARRVREAAELLGYRPNMNARGLRLRSTKSVGVIVPDVLSQLYPPLIRGIEQTLRSYDHFALVADSENDPDQERRALDNLVSRQVDGLIAATHTSGREALRDLAVRGTPVVSLELFADFPELSFVGPDMRSGVDGLADLLVAAGHRRIAHVSAPDTGGDARVRAGFHQDALTRLGLAPEAWIEVTATAFTVDAGQVATARLLAEHPEVTAVMAYNDLLAIGALRAVRAAGLRSPEDVSVTGFNDIPLIGELTPSLTSVRIDTMRQGREAAEVLMAMIAGTSGPQTRALPTTVVARTSHGPVRPG